MVPALRQAFHRRFTSDLYRRLLDRLETRCGLPIPFRNAETPCFFDRALLEQLTAYGRELIGQLMGNADYLAAAAQTIPPAYRLPNQSPRPLFVQVDFGLDETLQPKLVEIQGFPSLYAYQPCLTECYREVYDLDAGLGSFLGGLDQAAYDARLRQAILGSHDPENVILMEIEPEQQKTLPDFRLTERLCGIQTVCITALKKQGNRLFYPRQGRLVPVERIYNRVIVDELVRKEITPAFDFRDDLEVEWAGHPHWYFLISKFSLPYLKHPCVPETRFLDSFESLPDDLENYVLKPLFSFAGRGVTVGPTREEIDAIADRSQYVLQRRVNFAPVIETPCGPTKVEIRLMYLWPESDVCTENPADTNHLLPMTTLLRMGRGAMMGVDHNREMAWVGASAAFFP